MIIKREKLAESTQRVLEYLNSIYPVRQENRKSTLPLLDDSNKERVMPVPDRDDYLLRDWLSTSNGTKLFCLSYESPDSTPLEVRMFCKSDIFPYNYSHSDLIVRCESAIPGYKQIARSNGNIMQLKPVFNDFRYVFKAVRKLAEALKDN